MIRTAVLIVMILAVLTRPAAADEVADRTEKLKAAMIAVEIDQDMYTGVVIGDVARLRFALTVLNTCYYPNRIDIATIKVRRQGEKSADAQDAKVLSFAPENGLTLLAFVADGAAPQRPRPGNVLAPKFTLLALGRRDGPDSIYLAEAIIEVSREKSVMLGTEISPSDLNISINHIGGSLAVDTEGRLAGFIGAYFSKRERPRDCAADRDGKMFFLPLVRAMDVVGHFVGRTADLENQVTDLAKRVKDQGATLDLLRVPLEEYLRDVALNRDPKGPSTQRHEQAVQVLLAQYRVDPTPGRSLALAEELLRHPETQVFTIGLHVVLKLSISSSGDLVWKLVIDTAVSERVRERLLQQYSTTVAQQCDDKGRAWFQTERQKIEDGKSTLPNSIGKIVLEFSASMCSNTTAGSIFSR